ncbi:ferritin family protein [Sedimentisphaera salicampi]|uniref:Rubrerythrin diiron-binding domain-containing protein n=1 Tax=Sedimentisphaera salicampi TaxID=1941349 RepID=A0A1W6LM93_9BACT|nr:ferritin family protein [Sedimentisphaera salicampi]ARN56895.1 hypothetical protein STSP1_01288 [Sedimentisphaera salicampi]OXU15064.1 hypothetical protein SMSP1_01259 [Sedimentisphaera salicampi]
MNAMEVLEVAKTMETDGIEFYSRAAESADTESAGKLLEELAGWEKNHFEYFEKLQEAVKKADSFNPDNEAMKYLDYFVKYAVFSPEKDLAKKARSLDTTGVLSYAIGMEKDSVCYYLGVKASLKTEQAKETVEEIINEEMSHITILSEELSKV